MKKESSEAWKENPDPNPLPKGEGAGRDAVGEDGAISPAGDARIFSQRERAGGRAAPEAAPAAATQRPILRHRPPLSRTAVARARQLRREASYVERQVWRWLRDRRFSAYKFRRQHELGPYYLDFFCLESRLAIELDGRQHGHPGQAAADRVKDEWLAARGIKVLRFWNSTVLREKQAVRDAIWRELQDRAPRDLPAYQRPGVVKAAGGGVGPHPVPLPRGEGARPDASGLTGLSGSTDVAGASPSPSGRGTG